MLTKNEKQQNKKQINKKHNKTKQQYNIKNM